MISVFSSHEDLHVSSPVTENSPNLLFASKAHTTQWEGKQMLSLLPYSWPEQGHFQAMRPQLAVTLMRCICWGSRLKRPRKTPFGIFVEMLSISQIHVSNHLKSNLFSNRWRDPITIPRPHLGKSDIGIETFSFTYSWTLGY